MKLILMLLFIPVISFGQMNDSSRYSWKYLYSYYKENKLNLTDGTKSLIGEINSKHEPEKSQQELIQFYHDVYDFKIVDKTILKNLIDSLALYGKTGEIQSAAKKARAYIENRLLGKQIRDFQYPDKDGNLVQLSSLNNKIVIVELWTTWCSPCVAEMQKVKDLKKANPNIEFYSMSFDKTPAKMKRFTEKNNYDWPIVYCGEDALKSELGTYLHVAAIPKYYTINRDGIVIDVSDKLDEQFVKNLK